MSEIDAKVHMSLDEIIKMEKKKKKNNTGAANGKPGTKRNRGAIRGRTGFRGRGARIKRNNIGMTVKKQQMWQRGASNSNIRGGFKNRYRKNYNLVKPRGNLNVNQKTNARGAFNIRRGRGNRFGLTRSRSRTNLTFNQGGFFMNNKSTLKRTHSLPNLRDPTSVHNRLGYQSPAQIAYRNRVKRAKQLLLQRQHQRLSLQNQFRLSQTGKNLLSLQPRPVERRQQILTSQRRFTTGGLRSDQIARAQRRAQYEEKLMRMNAAQMAPNTNAHSMCMLRGENTHAVRQRHFAFKHGQHFDSTGNPLEAIKICIKRKLEPNINTIDQRGSILNAGSQSSLSAHRTNTSYEDIDCTLSEIMYNRSTVHYTERTLNDRFSS